MSEADPHGFLLRFEDGPLSALNCVNLPANETWTWPLPEHLSVLAHLDETTNVAMWESGTDGEGLPAEIIESPNVVHYEKVSESQLPHGTEFLARGVLYRLERT